MSVLITSHLPTSYQWHTRAVAIWIQRQPFADSYLYSCGFINPCWTELEVPSLELEVPSLELRCVLGCICVWLAQGLKRNIESSRDILKGESSHWLITDEARYNLCTTKKEAYAQEVSSFFLGIGSPLPGIRNMNVCAPIFELSAAFTVLTDHTTNDWLNKQHKKTSGLSSG